MPAPFGLEPGSTPPIGMADYSLLFHSVPKPHPAFNTYIGSWSPDHGLTRVIANSKLFEEEPDCTSARELYERIKRQLMQLYGQPEELQFADPDGTWPDESDFWQALRAGERNHYCRWSAGDGHKLEDRVERIDLLVSADDAYDVSHVSLAYTFVGFEKSEPAVEYGLDSL